MQEWKPKTTIFLFSQGITLFGSSIVQFALVWYITLQSSSGVWVSALTLCAFVPQFLVSFVSGALSDRCNKKYLIIASDAVIAAATLALARFWCRASPPILRFFTHFWLSPLSVLQAAAYRFRPLHP